jgi:hypothetical protein
MFGLNVASWEDLALSFAFVGGAIIGIFTGVFVVLRVLRIVTNMHVLHHRRGEDELDSEDPT